jgi:RNA polymerase sigma-70 factor (ECF subfamily)
VIAATTTVSDPQIIDLVRQGCPDGLGLLFDRYGLLSYSLAMRILADTTSAEETVQESFLSVWTGASIYHPQAGSVRSWLCSVVHDHAVNRLHNRERWLDAAMPLDRAASRDLDPDDSTFAARSLHNDIREALSGLTPQQRDVIELAYFGGRTQDETSLSLSVPLPTVTSATRAALSTLRSALEKSQSRAATS